MASILEVGRIGQERTRASDSLKLLIAITVLDPAAVDRLQFDKDEDVAIDFPLAAGSPFYSHDGTHAVFYHRPAIGFDPSLIPGVESDRGFRISVVTFAEAAAGITLSADALSPFQAVCLASVALGAEEIQYYDLPRIDGVTLADLLDAECSTIDIGDELFAENVDQDDPYLDLTADFNPHVCVALRVSIAARRRALGIDPPATKPQKQSGVPATVPQPARQSKVKTYTVQNAANLLRRKFDPVRWAVRGMLPEGVTILAGAPKIGKSWLTLQAAVAITAGLPLWEGREPETCGEALLLALEDNDRRMKSRLEKVLDAKGKVIPHENGFRIERPNIGDRLRYITDWPRIDQGGAQRLDEYLEQNPETRLVSIDTLAKFRSVDPGRKSAYDHDYEVGAALKPIADKHKVAIALVHHTRKMGSDDALDAVSGTQGLNGSVDATIVLRRGRGSSDGEMFITGRDIEDEETTAMKFDKASCLWSSLGPADEVNRSDARREILEHLKQAGASGPKDIAAAIGKNPNTTRVLLRKMAVNGDVNSTDGRYYLPEK